MEGNGLTPQSFSDEICYSRSFDLDTNAKVGQTFAILILCLVGNSLIAIAAVFITEIKTEATDYGGLLHSEHDMFRCSFSFIGSPRGITEKLSSPYEWHVDGFLGQALCRVTYIIQGVSIGVSIDSCG